MNQLERARVFADLHRRGEPLVLFNIWDAGTARSAARAGSKALATGSWSVAAAHGYDDGEALPLDLLETVVRRITASVELPVSVDFEGGYAENAETLRSNVARIIAAGAIGINFEDQIVGGVGLYETGRQADRIRAVRAAAEEVGIPLFINARTDIFLKERDRSRHGALVAEALERAAAYKAAGASGFFVPGLAEEALISEVVERAGLPVNVIVTDATPSLAALARLGVSRVSHGPRPYRQVQDFFAERCAAALRGE